MKIKILLTLISIVILFSCSRKDEMIDTTTVQLIGSKYAVFVEKKDYSAMPTVYHYYKDIYEVLSFSEKTVQRALWQTADWNESDTNGLVMMQGTAHTWNYSFSKDKLTIEEYGGKKYYGTKSGNTINIYGKNFTKQ